jgi:CDP-diacylglycerol---glycerol-3-phosphate 3-phosphatidyltransferase
MNPPAVPDHLGDVPQSVSAWNLPNALTGLRLGLVPVFAWLLWRSNSGDNAAAVAAAVVFAIASLTDFVDGDLARRRGQVTNFGKVADPIADKALTGTAFVGLSLMGELAWWVTIVVVVREVGVTVLRFWVIRHGVIPASRGGKVKTVLQIVAILMYLLPISGGWLTLRDVVMGGGGDRHRGHRRRLHGPCSGAAGQLLGGGAGRVSQQPGANAGEDVAQLLDRLALAGATVATAESLTGGLVAAALVQVPGASRVYRGGVVAYASDLKHSLLAVSQDLLADRGAVDPEVAQAMAEGARDRLQATYGVATTGVAGPDPQDEMPVGRVHVAVAGPDQTTVESLDLSGSRDVIRAQAAAVALILLDRVARAHQGD